jgi:vanillate O-demethylase monooxygenase subunit
VHIPGQQSIPPRARVPAFAVEERHGWVWLWYGEAHRADRSRIPEYPWFDDPRWRGFQLYFHVAAAAQLFVDNLLDLSHVAFTHRHSIGAASAANSEARLEVAVEPTRVIGCRTLRDVDPGPFIASWGDFPGRIDRTSTFTWRAPTNMEVKAEFADSRRKITIMVINPITPETETSSHFWLGWARDFALEDATLDERAKAENTQVILEDVAIIEAQQRRISERPQCEPVAIHSDRAIVAVHGVLRRLFAEQSESAPAAEGRSVAR